MLYSIKKSIIFLLPIFIIVLLPFFIFYKSGEFISTKYIVEKQLSEKPIIIGKILPYWGEKYSILDIIKNKKPKILTLGNSRVLQIRSEFFNDAIFFNGGGITDLRGYKKFLEKLSEEEKPEVIIIGLEQSYFHPVSNTTAIPDLALEENNSDALMRVLQAWRDIYFHIAKKTYSISYLFEKDSKVEKIGTMAYLKKSGKRNDGSYSYGIVYSTEDKRNKDFQFNDTLRRIEKGNNLFYQGNEISEESVKILRDFLDYCTQKNIHVVAFLPPYAQEVFDNMKSSGKYGYIFALEDKLRPMFIEHQANLFNFMDMSSFGAEKAEVVDGIHASEKAYFRLFIQMIEHDKKLASYTLDPIQLKLILDKTEGNNEVFN